MDQSICLKSVHFSGSSNVLLKCGSWPYTKSWAQFFINILIIQDLMYYCFHGSHVFKGSWSWDQGNSRLAGMVNLNFLAYAHFLQLPVLEKCTNTEKKKLTSEPNPSLVSFYLGGNHCYGINTYTCTFQVGYPLIGNLGLRTSVLSPTFSVSLAL